MSVRRAGVALEEREQDLRVHVAEQPQRTGPEPLELCAELVDDPGARRDEILPRAGDVRLALLLLSSVIVKQSNLAGNYLDS